FRSLRRIDGRGYKAYKDIEGTYDFGEFVLHIDHVQGDPFASPSKVRVEVEGRQARFPPELFKNKERRVALEDYIARAFERAIRKHVRGRRGSGNSGLFDIDAGGQEILERSCVNISPQRLEVRFVMGLPAAGRTILGGQAIEMFFDELPKVVRDSCFYRNLPAHEVKEHVTTSEDATFIRRRLRDLKLVAFIADGAILPRESGISQRPMPKGEAIPFKSPPSLRVTIETPNHGPITGMGIPEGVTLIVGGGYHGKSTLLRAIERGVYNHIPGDGREFVVTIEEAVKIRAEDGRRVERVDISPFIHNLPGGRDTESFSTDDASGSTSQAANIIEALEVGAKLLLIDEDTSATNFMIRDARMQRLVAKEKEPITPFIDRVRQLYEELGVSTILVMGGSGDYFDVADTVIMMDNFLPRDVTEEAKRIAKEMATGRVKEAADSFKAIRERCPHPGSIEPHKGEKLKLDAKGLHTIVIGRSIIDLSLVEQLVDESQTRAIAYAIYHALRR
ncbi:MAG TPA: ATPase, partial [Armatimonadetes bacterium]|nr:ATPase [Armatimonadota bacterium]